MRQYAMPGYLEALLLTLACELPIVAVAFRPRSRAVITALFVNLFTHGALDFFLPAWRTRELAIAECIIVIVEALLYMVLLPASPKRAFVTSLIANAASLSAGLLLFF